MHKSVLLEECLQYLNLKENSMIVDATLGYGGHSSEILKRIPKGYLYSFDQDKQAITYSQTKLIEIASNFEIIHTNFKNLKRELQKRNIQKIQGILFDLGVSSPQLDEKERGFSFHQDAKLDMRMDQSQPLSAYEVVNTYSYQELVRIFTQYGEEKYASSIAKKIIEQRITPIETTLQLVEIIKNAVPEKYKREHHPARKIFQAIRIEVNQELEVFKKTLQDALELLDINGRICVITFHSLEDKICKQIMKDACQIDPSLKKLPIIPIEYLPKFKIVATISPTEQELEENHRARSAKLRVIERIRGEL